MGEGLQVDWGDGGTGRMSVYCTGYFCICIQYSASLFEALQSYDEHEGMRYKNKNSFFSLNNDLILRHIVSKSRSS